MLALGWARPGGWAGLWISLCLHIGSWCCSERLDCARTPPWEPSWGRNGPHGPEPLDFIVLALGCSKNRPAQGGGAGLLIYSQNRWPRTPLPIKKKHCRCSVFCTYTKHYRWPRTPITYTTEAGVVPNDWIAPGHPHGSRHGVGTAPMAQNRWISLCLHWDALRTDPPRGVGRVY